MITRYISKKIKEKIALNQDGKCANSPFKPAINLRDYHCLLWKYQNGKFDESGYQIDHINEYSILLKKNDYNVNDMSNLQALCPNCHSVKTKRFIKYKKKFTSEEIESGYILIDLDSSIKESLSKKRKINII